MRLALMTAVGLWSMLMVISMSMSGEHLPAPPGVCADLSPLCIDLVPHCAVPSYAHLLRVACPISCGSCNTPLPTEEQFPCVDTRTECSRVAAVGQCSARPLLFWRDCPRACRVCNRPAESIVSATSAADAAAPLDPRPAAASTRRRRPAGAAVPCADETSDCASRAVAGECTMERTRAAMVRRCARSCGTCQLRQAENAPAELAPLPRSAIAAGSAGRGAVSDGDAWGEDVAEGGRATAGPRPRSMDRRRACAYWRSVGECDRARELMSELCAASCGVSAQSAEEVTPPEADEEVPCPPGPHSQVIAT